MSYRPKQKIDSTGTVADLPLDAETVKGIDIVDSNDGKIKSSVLPAIAITDTFVVNSQAAMLALTAEVGDICVRTDLNKSYILKTEGASTLANWQELLTPTDAVTSVNGQTGIVSLNYSDVGAAASSHTHSSYVNQNAFSNVKVGSSTIAADTATDTLELVGSNVTLTPDTTNDKVTIGITSTNVTTALGYTPGTSNLAIGSTSTTAAAGNHNHDSTYLKLSKITLSGTTLTIDLD